MIRKIMRNLAAGTLIATCISAVPATEPSDTSAGEPRPPTAVMPRRNVRAMPALSGRMPTTQEVRDGIDFAHENMPNLYRMLESARPGPRRRRLGGQAIREFRRYQQAQDNESPERAEAVLKQIRSLDAGVFALVREFYEAPPDKRDEIRQRLRDNMREVVASMLEERQQRIERLKQMLDREERALEADRTSSERMADDRLEKLLNETRPSRDVDATTEPVPEVDTHDAPPDRPR